MRDKSSEELLGMLIHAIDRIFFPKYIILIQSDFVRRAGACCISSSNA